MSGQPDSVACGACGALLEEAPSIPLAERVPCPKCGSITRTFNVSVAVRATLRDSLGFKHKRPGFKKPIAEGFSGWELRKTVGDLVRKLRLIDRENDHYQERVETEQGEVIHQVDHPLSEHRGHGSDKPELKKDKKESQRPT